MNDETIQTIFEDICVWFIILVGLVMVYLLLTNPLPVEKGVLYVDCTGDGELDNKFRGPIYTDFIEDEQVSKICSDNFDVDEYYIYTQKDIEIINRINQIEIEKP